MLRLIMCLAMAQPALRSERSDSLLLPKDVAMQVNRYAARVQKFKESAKDEGLCLLLQQATKLEQALVPPLALSMEQTAKLPAKWDQEITALNRKLPGIFFLRGMDSLTHGVDVRALAARASSKSPTAMALAITGSLLPPGLPAYFEPQSDLTGCTNPTKLFLPLQELQKVWKHTAPCMQTALIPLLKQALQKVSEATCFCGNQAETQKTVGQLERLLDELPSLDGQDAMSRLQTTLQQGKGRFACSAQDY